MRGYFFIILAIYNFSCVPHRAYVASPYEPVTVKKKGDLNTSCSIRPWKFVKVNGQYAPFDWLGLQAAWGGWKSLDNFEGSLIFYKRFNTHQFNIAPTYNYEHNVINGSLFVMKNTGPYKIYRYNCKYQSVGLLLEYSKTLDTVVSFHFMFRFGYNKVNRYNYYYYADDTPMDSISKNNVFLIYANETLDINLPPFYTFEPQMAIIFRAAKRLTIKAQCGLTLRNSVYTHTYVYYPGPWLGRSGSTSTNHPQFLPANYSLGMIYHINLQGRPEEKYVEE